MSDAPTIKPLSVGRTIIYLAIPAAILFATHYYLIPGYVERNHVPYFNAYWVGYAVTMGMFLVAALIGYRLEGHPYSWETLRERFRLRAMTGGDWLLSGALIALTLGCYFGLSFTGKWVNAVPFLAHRPGWPAEWGPGGALQTTPGEFMGVKLAGQWWVLLVYFVGWLMNIAGEEFWFRGYLLPRHEAAYGRAAWVANGLMFWLTHIYQPWILIAILPTILLLVFVVQTRRNTWIGIVQHGFVNGVTMIFLVAGIVGG